MKKNLDYYLSLPYKLCITPDFEEDGYIAEYPELPGCVTCGETIDDVISLAKDAKKCWITVAYNNNDDIPIPNTLPGRV